ncbi:SCP domain-containing protein [Aphelenchoides bicaudatus]|nr:SCP domain-containing protein [Aphelenchoides bicaudatus]
MKSKFIVLLVAIVLLAVVLEAKMSKKIRKSIVKQQNKFRSKVAKGKCANGTGTLPKAGNMYTLVYSKKLEKKAVKAAKLCSLNITGATVFVAIGTVKSAALAKDATKNWAAELSGNITLPSLTYSAVNASAYSNFTQLIWASSKQIGCASATCANVTGSSISGSATIFVCKYKNVGNVEGTVIYKKSKKPGKNCPRKARANKKTGLCKKRKSKKNSSNSGSKERKSKKNSKSRGD